ncbi:hypothetical protein SAMN02745121_01052 [Nannocystis exedens]|uniref:Uncharacterized protein n=1 Tax=Nannocystis exedens TaxID=54 RepID=A0A1I1U8E1_9BACT|nr:hypothetical protein NAEX_04584 [Nannocystis exedens]SFD67116.1 hypothetical protein SAMN02745121_01052 [Nannocystis exedens]
MVRVDLDVGGCLRLMPSDCVDTGELDSSTMITSGSRPTRRKKRLEGQSDGVAGSSLNFTLRLTQLR